MHPLPVPTTHHRSALSAGLVTLAAAAVLASAFPAAANMGSDDKPAASAAMTTARAAIDKSDWSGAEGTLRKVVADEPRNADAWNWLGFSLRKQGRLDDAFTAYAKALEIDPRHKAAHEYAGEAALLAKNLPKAEAHLAELTKLCSPIPCEELKELKAAVDAYRKAAK
jgi:Flp pilus assembly protein TadD